MKKKTFLSLIFSWVGCLFLFPHSVLAAYTPFPISSNANHEVSERAFITNSGSCSISSQSGSWVTSVSHPSTGQCTLTITGFSAVPACVCSPFFNTNRTCTIVSTPNPTSLTIETVTANTAASFDASFFIICRGPK